MKRGVDLATACTTQQPRLQTLVMNSKRQAHLTCVVQGLEVYSTVLWHMKREVDLANLSHEAVQLDWHSPQAWVVMGNCFSLQKVLPACLPAQLRWARRLVLLETT